MRPSRWRSRTCSWPTSSRAKGRALVLALNKWDLVAEPQARLKELEADLGETLAQLRGVPMVPISSKTGYGLDRLMRERCLSIHATWNKRIATAALNRWLLATRSAIRRPPSRGRRIKLKYLTQSKTRPPTFFLSCSRPEALPDSYRASWSTACARISGSPACRSA